jgi:transcriptional regulator with XRE-family HTH domain
MALDAAVEAGEIVDALRPFGIKQQEIADVVHVSDRAVRAWRTGSIQGPRYDRLAELRDLVSLLSDSLTPRGVGQWLHARNRSLGGERPLDVLREGDFERVEKAARSFVEGGYV